MPPTLSPIPSIEPRICPPPPRCFWVVQPWFWGSRPVVLPALLLWQPRPPQRLLQRHLLHLLPVILRRQPSATLPDLPRRLRGDRPRRMRANPAQPDGVQRRLQLPELRGVAGDNDNGYHYGSDSLALGRQP